MVVGDSNQSEPNFRFGCFVIGVVVVVGLRKQPNNIFGCFVFGVVVVVSQFLKTVTIGRS